MFKRVKDNYMNSTNGRILVVLLVVTMLSAVLIGRLFVLQIVNGEETLVLPEETMIGALSRYISSSAISDFQPMSSNFGILPPIEERIRDKKERYGKMAERSLGFLNSVGRE